MPSMQLSRVRLIVSNSLERNLFENAAFWADKAISLSNGALQDVLSLAQALFLDGNYRRAAHLIKSRGLIESALACRYLVAKCHAKCKEWNAVIDVLDLPDTNLRVASSQSESPFRNLAGFDSSTINIMSSICLLRGTACQAIENRQYAAKNYKEALQLDVFCHEAFSRLVSYHLLTMNELKTLLASLPFEDQCVDKEEAESLRLLYHNQLNEFCSPEDFEVPEGLANSLDVAVFQAQRDYNLWNQESAIALTNRVLLADPYHTLCLPVHVACLVALNRSNDLFLLAHKLIEDDPEKAFSWYAVGSYYLMTGKLEMARRFLTKAIGIDSQLGLFWIALGHSFAQEGEHDQAIASYQVAVKHMPGCHFPLLYVGQEFIKIDLVLAEQFLSQAQVLSPDDPDVLHELGVLHHQAGRYTRGRSYLLRALEKVKEIVGKLSGHWEPLLNNCGHSCRKLGMYEEAAQYHQEALKLISTNPNTHTALGYAYSLMERHGEAVAAYHKALGLRRNDTFAAQMLDKALEAVFKLEFAREKDDENGKGRSDEDKDDDGNGDVADMSFD